MGRSDLEYMILPGMDGNADLTVRLMCALPEGLRKSAPKFSADVVVSYEQLLSMVEFMAPEQTYLLIAQSYSTPLAIRFAALHPPHLQGLVLCAGFAASPVRGWRRWAAWTASWFLFRMPMSNSILGRFLVGTGADPELLKEVRAAISAPKPGVLAARFREVLSCDVREELVSVSVPILYLQAKEDRLVDHDCLHKIHAVKPDVAVERISGPHLLLQREPELAAKAIAKWMHELGLPAS